MFRVKVGSESVVYTGDYTTSPDRHLGTFPARTLSPFLYPIAARSRGRRDVLSFHCVQWLRFTCYDVFVTDGWCPTLAVVCVVVLP